MLRNKCSTALPIAKPLLRGCDPAIGGNLKASQLCPPACNKCSDDNCLLPRRRRVAFSVELFGGTLKAIQLCPPTCNKCRDDNCFLPRQRRVATRDRGKSESASSCGTRRDRFLRQSMAVDFEGVWGLRTRHSGAVLSGGGSLSRRLRLVCAVVTR